MKAPTEMCEINMERIGDIQCILEERSLELLDFDGNSKMTLSTQNEEFWRNI